MSNLYANVAALIALAALASSSPSFAASDPDVKQSAGAGKAPASQARAVRKPAAESVSAHAAGPKPCVSVTVDPPTQVTLGKSTVIRLSVPVSRIVVGGHAASHAGKPVGSDDENAAPASAAARPAAPAGSDGVAHVDITLLSPTELFFLGRRPGSMNVILQNSDGRCLIKDIVVTIDPDTLQAKLAELMPRETGVRVRSAESALVLTGDVSDAIKLDQIVNLATSYGDGKKVVNLLRITTPQQVMLEVKIAEVSKTLIDKLGSSVAIKRSSDAGVNAFSLLSNFLAGGGGLLEALKIGRTAVGIDGQKDDGLVRVLAEPNIMAISGQAASFLSGGKIFIPVATSGTAGTPIITLSEKEFGIGVKFTPTVLDGSRINLKLVSEVSDLSQTGSPFTSFNGVVSVIPSMTIRRADTTVQLNDGQSFVIAGLIKNNSTAAIKRFPGLGEVPVLGALFRSSEFQKDQTELIFVITPRLVKPLAEVPTLPTDNHIAPDRADVLLMGKTEGSAPDPAAMVKP